MTDYIELKVLKRGNEVVPFEKDKIIFALEKAFKEVYATIPNVIYRDLLLIVEEVCETIYNLEFEYITIDEIQELIVSELLESEHQDVALKYINYKTTKSVERLKSTGLDKQIDRLLQKDETIINENANKDSRVFNTQRDLTSGVVARHTGLKMLPERVAKAHISGDIHHHDLDYMPFMPMTNCCLLDVETMLRDGSLIGNVKVNQPNSILVAASLIIQMLGATSSSEYGGISIHEIDKVLEPYAEKSYQKYLADVEKYKIPNGKQYAKDKIIKEIYDSMQAFEYEVNSLTSSSGQSPFTTISFGRTKSFLGKEIQKAILNVRIGGLADGSTAIFPKLVFFLEDGVNLKPLDVNYDIKTLAIECSTKRIYPDIVSVKRIKELSGGSVVSPMGCRSFLPNWINPKTGLEEVAGRMNLGVQTLNLPRIGIESKGNISDFWNIFDERMSILKEDVVFRINRIKDAKPENAPILYQQGGFKHKLKAEDSVWDVFKDQRATISIGYIGIYEATSSIYGLDWEQNAEAKEFSLEILKRMKDYADAWKTETDVWVSVYGTPSESLTDRFCRLDREKFGNIKGITDKEYYTNSFHYDVHKKPTPFEKLAFEQDYAQYTSGGFIHYVEYPNIRQNPKALEAVWDYSYDKIGYLGANIPIDKCFKCGFNGEFLATERGYVCPDCKNNDPETCDVVKRLCGYLGQPQKRPPAKGRQKEIKARNKHM